MQSNEKCSKGLRSEADVIAFESTPLSQRGLPQTTYAALKAAADQAPHATALSFFADIEGIESPFQWTHAEFIAHITRTANALRQMGIGRDDVVAYILPNMPETHLTIWGGSAAGQVLAINPMLESDQMAELMHAARVRVLVTVDEYGSSDIWRKAGEAAANQADLRHVLLCSLKNYAMHDGVWRMGEDQASLSNNTHALPVSRFWDVVLSAPSNELDFTAPTGADNSTLLCTGGTTGLPKIAIRTHQAEVFNAWASSRFSPDLYTVGATSFCGLPLFHSNAIIVSGLLPLMFGGHVLLAGSMGYRTEGILAKFWKIVERYRVELFSGVPTIYDNLLKTPIADADISSLICGACGAAPMPVQLFKQFEAETGVRIVEGYGLTEAMVTSSRNPFYVEQPRVGSIGLRLPYQQMRLALFNDASEFSRWAKHEEVGEICISGPNVFRGYLLAEQNQGIWLEVEGQKWFRTGDLARQDADGYFWMTGRQKELIIRGGHNIDPKLIEEAMHAHPQIALAAAVGRPDPRVGELPVLYYTSKSGEDIAPAELQDFARARIPERAAVPKDFVRLSDLPLTGVGKIHKISLNLLEIEGVVRREAAQLGIELIALDARQDARRGLVAHVTVKSGQSSLSAALESYVFPVDFECSVDQPAHTDACRQKEFEH